MLSLWLKHCILDCYITTTPSGKASRVLANNGKESELYTSLLSVPFIENGAESIDLYGKLISLDFLKEKHIQDDNGEPKLYFMAGNSNVNPLFESFANAKIAYPNSPIIAGFAKYGKLQEYNNRSYAPMNQFTPIASFANILSDGNTKNDIINNLIVTGAVKGKMSWGMKLKDKVKAYSEPLKFSTSIIENKPPSSNITKYVTEYLKSKGFPLNILSEQQMIEEARKLGYENFSEVPQTLTKNERIYGFYNPQNNQIYLTEEVMNSDTLTHELWHFYRPILSNQASSGNKTAEALLKRFDELALTVLGGEDKLREYFDGASKSNNVQVDFEMQKATEEAINIPLIKDEKGSLLAPNGKISNLNETQWKIARTEAFKKWFGDWENDSQNASKVVDENGEPLVVYHRTFDDFEEFDNTKGTYKKGFIGGNLFYFSDDRYGYSNYGDKEIAVFINLRNPTYKVNVDGEYIKSSNDGAILKFDRFGEKEILVVAAKPSQIKLADGSNVTFGETSDIRFKTDDTQNNINFAEISNKLKNNGLQRLSKESEQGRSESGEINAISTIISAAVQRNVQEKYGVSNANAISETKRLETNALEQYANDNELIVSLPNSEVIGGGNESDIYEHSNPSLITKVTFPNNYNSWLEMFDSIAIHNAENPTTKIKINGFATNKDGEFSIVTEQNLIQGTPPQFKTIHEDLISKGYELSGEYGDGRYIHREKGIVLEDVKEDNVLEDSQGNLHYIDTDFYPYDKQRGGNLVLSELPDIRFKTENNDNTTETFGETRANNQGETSINNKEDLSEDMAQNGKERLFDNAKSENVESQGVYNVVSPPFSSEVYAPRQNETFDSYKDRMVEESMARILGENSSAYFERIAKEAGLNDKETKSFVEKVKQFILDFADWLGKQLGLTDITPEQLSKMTNKEIFDAVITSMISGDYIEKNFDNMSNTSNDIRFSIIGERAASNVENYKKSLEEAKLMEENGASPIEIESKTKWYKYQGQWRTLSNEAIRAFKDIKLPEINKKTSLKNILGNENILLKMYPSLGGINVTIVGENNKKVPEDVKNALQNSGGLYRPENGHIYINSDLQDTSNETEAEAGGLSRRFNFILIHEMQHAIQQEESMPRGGNLFTLLRKSYSLLKLDPESVSYGQAKEAISNRDKSKFNNEDNKILDRATSNIDAILSNNNQKLKEDYSSLMGEIDANIAEKAFNALLVYGDDFDIMYSDRLASYLYSKNISEQDILSIYESAIQLNIVGEVGAANLNDSIQTMNNLSIAKEMFAKKKSPKAIKNATGWEYFAPENKWKLELDYGTTKNLSLLRELANNISFNREYVNNVSYKLRDNGNYDIKMYYTDTGTNIKDSKIEYSDLSKKELSTFLGKELASEIIAEKGIDIAEEWGLLYDDYAEKAFEIQGKYKVSVGNAIKLSDIFVAPDLYKAFPKLKNIDVVVHNLKSGEAAWDGENIILSHKAAIKNDKYIRSALVHEVQHFIQEQEGFAVGGAAETEFSYEDELILTKYANSEKSASEFLSDPNVKYLLTESPEIKEIIEDKTKLQISLTLKDAKLSAYDKYKKLAGEVEARNVQARAEISKAKRLKTLLSETEDVAPEDKIYLYGSIVSSNEQSIQDKIIAKRKELALAKLDGNENNIARISTELSELTGEKSQPNAPSMLNLDTTVKQDIEFKIATNPKYIVDALIQGGYVQQDCSL